MSPRCILLLLALVCGAPAWAQGTATVAGVVVNSVTRQPIARVLVESPAGGPGVLTDNAGRFSFAGVPVGATQLRYRRPGYFDPQSGANQASLPVTVAGNGQEQMLLLEPASILRGQVALSDGDSPAGMHVTLLREHVVDGWRRWQRRANATVRADGSFSFENLQPGSYLVHAEASLDPVPGDAPPRVRTGYAPVYAPDAGDAASASIFTLLAGQTGEARLRLHRVPFYPVKVRVDGEAQGQFQVSGNGFTDWNARYSREDGTVKTELPTGNYLLTGRSFGRDSEMGELPLHVTGAPVSGPVLTLNGVGAITVQSTGEGEGGRGVLLTLTPVAAEGQIQTIFVNPGEEDRAQAVRSMPLPGQYWVSASVSGGYIAELRSGGVDLFSAPLRIAAGTSPAVSAVIRQDGGSVTVTRTGEALARPCSLQVLPLDRGGIARHSELGASGELALSNLPPGDYMVLATSSRDELPYREPGVLQQLKGVRVTVTAGGSAQATVSSVFTAAGAL